MKYVDANRNNIMKKIKDFASKVSGNYQMLGVRGIIEYLSYYSVQNLILFAVRVNKRLLPKHRIIKLAEKKTPRKKMKVFYANTISKPQKKNRIYDTIKAYCNIGTLMTFDYGKQAGLYGRSQMSQRLVEAILNFKPDLIHLCKSDLLPDSTIKKIRRVSNAYIIFNSQRLKTNKFLTRVKDIKI